MVAITETAPDFDPDFERVQALRANLTPKSAVNRPGRVFVGSVLIISAVGLWLVPVDQGDAAMRLIKLLFSVVMLLLGAMMLCSLNERENQPEIQLDTKNRVLHVLRHCDNTNRTVRSSYGFDELAELSLKDRHLTARSAGGELIASIPLPNRREAAALEQTLNGLV